MSHELIAPQEGVAFLMAHGDSLVVTAPQGMQVADLYCFSRADLHDGLSSGRSIDYNESIRFGVGSTLYAQSGQPMFRIVEDTSEGHDFLVTPCSAQMFRMMSKTDAHHPSCLENLVTHLAPYGIGAHQIGTTFNIFMNVPVSADGRIQVLPPRVAAGGHIRLHAEIDLIVGLTACADEGSNGGVCKPIAYERLKAGA